MCLRSKLYFLLRKSINKLLHFSEKIRLAHAFRSAPGASDLDDLQEVLKILRGEIKLSPRPPSDKLAVVKAEEYLEISSSPVYTFAGCLHPKLGTIGLVITIDCLDSCLQGASRCDTGGLSNGYGAFEGIPETERKSVVQELSFSDESWSWAFSSELASSYVKVRHYVEGICPNHAKWSDRRAECIQSHISKHHSDPDRRTWTWEVRLSSSPSVDHFESLILSPEAFKLLNSLRRMGEDVPKQIKIISGSVTSSGVHHFDESATVDALCGL